MTVVRVELLETVGAVLPQPTTGLKAKGAI